MYIALAIHHQKTNRRCDDRIVIVDTLKRGRGGERNREEERGGERREERGGKRRREEERGGERRREGERVRGREGERER